MIHLISKVPITQLVAMIVGLSPGLVFPFVVALGLSASGADELLLSQSFCLLIINIFGLAIETYTVVIYAQHQLENSTTLGESLRSLAQNALLLSMACTLIAAPFLLWIYWYAGALKQSILISVVVFLMVGIVASLSSVASGALIAAGRSHISLGTQGIRAIAGIATFIVYENPPAVLVAVLFLLGEAVRCGTLWFIVGQQLTYGPTAVREDGREQRRVLLAQFGGNSLLQGAPMIDRLILARAGAGNITAYELADKVLYAIVQVVYSMGVLRRFSRWTKRPGEPGGRDAYLRYRSDVVLLVYVSIGLSLLSSALALGIWSSEILPDEYRTGIIFAFFLLPAVAPTIALYSSMRMLLVLGGERWILPASATGLLISAACSGGFFLMVGPVGVILGRTVARVSTALLYGVIVSRLSRATNVSNTF